MLDDAFCPVTAMTEPSRQSFLDDLFVASATFCTLCHLHNCDPMVFGCSGATNLGTAMPLVIWPHLLDALEIFEALP